MSDTTTPRGPTSCEWITTFVVRHFAGSEEGAIFQRNEMDRVLRDNGTGEVVAAMTKPGDAAGEGARRIMEVDE